MTATNPGGTPGEHGFRMPAEWARHAGTWIAWPHNPSDWPSKFQAIPWVYADIVRHLSAVEDVHILVNDAAAEKRARGVLTRSGVSLARVLFHQWQTNRGWMRDSGPIFVKNPQGVTAITNWKFNAWAKYEDWQLDDQVPDHVAGLLKLPEWKPTVGENRVVLEGGSIDTNGAGLLLTTEECLLSDVQQRNPGLSREDLERVFHDYLGIEQVIWLNRGIAGDDTHGHVDDITRFVDENRIMTAVESNRDDENYEPLQENLDRLKSAQNLAGDAFEIVELPMPSPVVFDGRRLPASYANFYIANERVLVPTFNDPNDRKALGVLAEAFPGRTITGIHCGDLIWGLGALHCMTQQQPL
jgi:agmatine deiminase